MEGDIFMVYTHIESYLYIHRETERERASDKEKRVSLRDTALVLDVYCQTGQLLLQ